MKRSLFFFFMIGVAAVGGLHAQPIIPDSVDVLHYRLTLDLGHNVDKQLQGVAEITFVKTRDCGSVTFDLIADSIHPVSLDGVVTRGYSYDADNFLLRVYVGGLAGDTHMVSIPYFTKGHVEAYGFGGMHMDGGIHYNLGAAFQEYPHNYGRCLYPCRDNFHDKATYTYIVTSKPGWRSLCSGIKTASTTNGDGSLTEEWQLTQPSPTYISSVSSAPWKVIETQYEGAVHPYPATLGYVGHDSAGVAAHFDMLNRVVPMFERCFGPYRWQRIGYISTPQGSMEHAQNIALVSACMSTNDMPCIMTTCHELGHAWFGNLLTCATAGDMWINEGGASFCEEVAAEAIYGPSQAASYYMDNLSTVLRTAHHSDGGYYALSGMPELITYGTTTYDKGALVWHSLRGLMGDSLFYSSMRRLFDRCAFGIIDATSLRDSLSLYSGMDLTGFFNFHVFTPGFVDYAIESFHAEDNSATLTLRQLLKGATRYATGNRVPVTFFSADLQQSDQWMLFGDSVATQSFGLPFRAAFAVVDYHGLLSDACTGGSTVLKKKGSVEIPYSYSKISVTRDLSADGTTYWLHVGHHYAHPTGDTIPGITRLSNRYWQVTGNIPEPESGPAPDANLLLHYNQGAFGQDAAFLDEGFYHQNATLDSICVVYRPDATHPWQVLSHKRLSSSSWTSGYFVAPLHAGQYALAVADTALLSLRTPGTVAAKPQLRLFPNPATTDFTVDLGGHDKKINLSVYDILGQKVLERKSLTDGCTVRHNLPAGTYMVLIKNNFLSLQSQIIIQ